MSKRSRPSAESRPRDRDPNVRMTEAQLTQRDAMLRAHPTGHVGPRRKQLHDILQARHLRDAGPGVRGDRIWMNRCLLPLIIKALVEDVTRMTDIVDGELSGAVQKLEEMRNQVSALTDVMTPQL